MFRTALGFLAVLLTASWASAQTIYVDSVAGSDSNDGSSEAKPKKSLPSGGFGGSKFDKLYLKAGGTYESTGLNVSNATVARYGDGDAPVVLFTSGQYGLVMVGDNALVDGIKVKGASKDITATAFTMNGTGSEVANCEVDGAGSAIMMGFGVSGTGNYIHHNNVHDLGVSVSGAEMGTSGGAEAYMIMGSDNEIAYNVAINCYSENSTLGGAEGGCLEIVNQKAKSTISGVSFHHNYCQFSVGLFEACSGDFSGQDQIQLNHAIIRDSYVGYNVAVDAMWLYLLQPVNTDFTNLVFEHNTLVHTAANEDIPQGAASAFTLAVEQETVNGTKYGPYPVKAGDITVRNNVFLVLGGKGMFNGTMPAGDNYNNLYAGVAFPNNWTKDPTEVVVADGAAAGLGADGRPAGADSAVVDKGSTKAVREDWVDFDGNTVPQGTLPDIGAFEYCEGDNCKDAPDPGTGGTSGTGGESSGGDTATGGDTAAEGDTAAGGTTAAGGSAPAGGTTTAGGSTPAGGNSATTSATGGSSVAPATGGGGTCAGSLCVGTATGGDVTVPIETPVEPEPTASELSDEGGCGCVAAGSGSSGRGALVGLLLGLIALGQRRRKSQLMVSRDFAPERVAPDAPRSIGMRRV